MAKVIILNYGMGNLHSLKSAFDRIKVQAEISNDPKDLKTATHLVLPGVGHFGEAIKKIKQSQLIEPLNEWALEQQKPVLGICLGMQLMASSSQEGDVEGLNWIPGQVLKMEVEEKLRYKIPHMAWEKVSAATQHPILEGLSNEAEFYFVHSYHYVPEQKEAVLQTANYESQFVCAVQNKNIVGVQYHPEKSYDDGSQILRNFTHFSAI